MNRLFKSYRGKYGYEELTGDEYILRVSSLHNHNTQTHNLSVSEQTAVSTREQLKLRGITDREQINERIDRDVFEQLKHKFDNTCQHDWQIESIKYHGVFFRSTTVTEYCTKCGAKRLKCI